MKILLITSYVPYPPDNGAKIRVLNLMQRVSRHHEVTLLCMVNPASDENERAGSLVERYCTQVETVARRRRSKQERVSHLIKATLKGEPVRNARFYFEEMADRIKTLTATELFDIVDIQHTNMSPYVEAISPASRCRKILTMHNMSSVQFRRMMLIEANWYNKLKLFLDWLFLKRSLIRHARRFDKCIMVSELDRDTLSQIAPDLDMSVVPNGVDTRVYTALAESPALPTLLFVGLMSYVPNVEAAVSLCREIFPLVKRRMPNARLFIVGSEPVEQVRRLAATKDVVVTGRVDDVVPYYRQAHISVVPLRAGGGTRLKILESMALGRPVVSTSIGCEGLAVTHGENILIADTSADFAARTVELLNDKGLRQRLIVNGRRLVEATYDWEVINQQLLRVYDEVVSMKKQGT